jgi:ketosteroid isomerase-like protein
MKATPREIVLELYRLWSEQGVEAAMAHVSPEIEWIEPAEAVGRPTRHGIDDALEGYHSWTEMYDDYDGDIAAVEDNGDDVLAHFIQRGRPRGGTKSVEEPVYMLWTVRDGLAVRMQMFFDVEDARAALHAAER